MADDYTMDITAGIDVGNGYVKAKLAIDGADPVTADLPSCVVWRSRVRDIPVAPTDAYMDDLVNELDCEVHSTAIKQTDQSRVLVGRRAVASGFSPIMFDINDAHPKCNESLSYQLILSVLASTAVSEFYRRHHALPAEILRVEAYVGVALPIADFMDYSENYRHSLMNTAHTVHIYNFDEEVTVKISFVGVEVVAEGAAAQYAIVDMGPAFMDACLAAARHSGMVIDESETGESLLSYDNTVGIDIGEGTVNFPVFRNGRVSVEASDSIKRGYGTMLDQVIEDLRDLAYAPKTRKELSEFMLKQNPNPRDRKLMEKLSVSIKDNSIMFAREIQSAYNRIMNKVQLNVDVVYVYGGGANAMRDSLYPFLIEASKLDEDTYTPVIWLDSTFSRDLNRNGLFVVAKVAREARGL